jgi:hypothetical protein
MEAYVVHVCVERGGSCIEGVGRWHFKIATGLLERGDSGIEGVTAHSSVLYILHVYIKDYCWAEEYQWYSMSSKSHI